MSRNFSPARPSKRMAELISADILMRIVSTFAILTCTLAVPAWAHDAETLVVHEWGTFTSLQDEEGNAIGGINTDDEGLPSFVHSLRGDLVVSPASSNALFSKG